ncbi:MAG TPA: hypothetical protein VFS05_08550, partial [Gemmatimonadaceae bacterium]|nr:hypothetical protein [Gemmatimonadaceae bacterium]
MCDMGRSSRTLAVITCGLLLAATAGARAVDAQAAGTQTAVPMVMRGADSALDNGNFHFSTDARA